MENMLEQEQEGNINIISDEVVEKINRTLKWYLNNMIVTLAEVKHSKSNFRVKTEEDVASVLDKIRNTETRINYWINDVERKLKKLSMNMNNNTNFSEVSYKPSVKKFNKLTLKRTDDVVYTDDNFSLINDSFTSEHKEMVINNTEVPIAKLCILLDNYSVVFHTNSHSLNEGISVVNKKGEIVNEDCCHAESEDGFLKINSFALKDDEQFKICYRNTICIIRRKDEVPEQEFFDSEKSVLEYDDNIPTSTSAKGGKCAERDADNLNNDVRSDGDVTYYSSIIVKDEPKEDSVDYDCDNATELINAEPESVTFDVPFLEEQKSTKEQIEMLENLLSETTDSISDDSSSSSEDMKVPRPPQTTHQGRVVYPNLLNMRQEILNDDVKECFVKISRNAELDALLKGRRTSMSDDEAEEREIQRLTNLNLLKRRAAENVNRQKVFKKRKTAKISTSKSSSSSSTSRSSEIATSGEEMRVLPTPPPIEAEPVPEQQLEQQQNAETNMNIQKLELLAEINSDKESDETSQADGSPEKPTSTTTTTNNDDNNPESDKEKKKAKKKAKWRLDPLLNTRLGLSSSSDSDSSTGSNILKKKVIDKLEQNDEKRNAKINATNDGQGASTSASKENGLLPSGSDSDKTVIKKVRKLSSTESESASTISDSSDHDNVLNISSDSEKENLTQGRRNIRALISDDILTDATKKANEEEETRKQRLLEKGKRLENFYSQASVPEETLVLDADDDYRPLVTVHTKLLARLKPHQKEGIKFMWNVCYESLNCLKTDPGTGCILAHCMGLGKTFQIIALIHTLFAHPETNTKHVLIVCPLSTVLNWQNEFNIGLEGVKNMNVFKICDQTRAKPQRLYIVNRWWKETGVLICGHDSYVALVKNKKYGINEEKLAEALIDPGPDLFVCDEGHLLKNNKTNKCKHFSNIKTKRRIVLTGTPMQNNLKEYYHMVQFVKPNLLGSYKEFTNRFVNPITNGQFHDSNTNDIHLMKKRSHVLHKLLMSTVQRYEASELQLYLPKKRDFVLYVRLTELQASLYTKYTDVISVQENVKRDSALFQHYHNLQLVWNHPLMIELKEKQNSAKKPKEVDTINLEPEVQEIMVPKNSLNDLATQDLYERLDYGSKFCVVQSIIEECEVIGDKVLIFSSSLIALDALEIFLQKFGTKVKPSWKKDRDYYRLDGTVPPDSRVLLCNKFNDPQSKANAFLITHKVGGLGLNLVAANRVVLLDVCWNPSYDIQSIFRIYRFGQTKECYVYRLVSKGTLEETIYNRSISKLATARRVVDERQIDRHFRMRDLKFLYQFTDDLESNRPIPKVPPDNLLAVLLNKHPKMIYQYHEHQSLLENLPHEELDEEEMKVAWDEFNKEQNMKNEQLPPPVSAENIPPPPPLVDSNKTLKPNIISTMTERMKQLMFHTHHMINTNPAVYAPHQVDILESSILNGAVAETTEELNQDVIVIED